MASPVSFDVCVADLKPLPAGSLMLVASHRPQWRDATLSLVALNLAIDDHPILYLALGEVAESALDRFGANCHNVCTEWAERDADEQLGSRPPTLPQSTPQSDREKAKDRWKTSRAKLIKKLYEGHAEGFTHNGFQFHGVVEPNMEEVYRAMLNGRSRYLGNPLPLVVLVDDLCAIQRARGKSGGPKLCGEHARALKDFAVEHGMLVVAGMPAPFILKTVARHGLKVEEEVLLKPGDLNAYGSPDEVCDAAVSTYRGLTDVGWCLIDHAFVHRYGITT